MHIEDFIKNIRESSGYMVDIFTKGDCFKFYKLLQQFYNVKGYITEDKQHVVAKYEGKFYDINGEYKGENLIPLTYKDHADCMNWDFKRNHTLVVAECPHCEEPITY